MSARRLLAAVVCALATACQPSEPLVAPDVVARLGERELRYAAFESYLERNLGEPGGALASAALSRLFDQYLTEELLADLARERGLVGSAAPVGEAVEALLATGPDREPRRDEIESYFAAHRDEFERPARVHLRQILVDERLTAERARRELAAGAPFAQVLTRLTPPGGSPPGGDQGVLARDELPPTFADLVFRLEAGQVSEVVAADYGFHVFQVVETFPAESLPLAEAEPEIRGRLRQAAADRALSRLVAEARSRYTVLVYERNLPFNYRGAHPVARAHEDR